MLPGAQREPDACYGDRRVRDLRARPHRQTGPPRPLPDRDDEDQTGARSGIMERLYFKKHPYWKAIKFYLLKGILNSSTAVSLGIMF